MKFKNFINDLAYFVVVTPDIKIQYDSMIISLVKKDYPHPDTKFIYTCDVIDALLTKYQLRSSYIEPEQRACDNAYQRTYTITDDQNNEYKLTIITTAHNYEYYHSYTNITIVIKNELIVKFVFDRDQKLFNPKLLLSPSLPLLSGFDGVFISVGGNGLGGLYSFHGQSSE